MVDTIPSFLVNITPFCYENYLTPNFYPTNRDTKKQKRTVYKALQTLSRNLYLCFKILKDI